MADAAKGEELLDRRDTGKRDGDASPSERPDAPDQPAKKRPRRNTTASNGPKVSGAIYISDVLKPCEQTAKALLGAEAAFNGVHWDEFLYRVRFGERDWTDNDDRATVCYLQEAYTAPGITLTHVRNAIRALAYQRRRDSLQDFVTMALPAWDLTPRIVMMLHDAWGAPDNPMMRAASRNLPIAMIARALQPGAQVDELYCFEGAQGTHKSRSLRALGGPEGFHAEMTAPIGSPDFYRQLRGIWIAEISELDSIHGREASTVKRVLSAPEDRFVEKYESHASTYKRRAVAVATTNEATYWQDSTGARRLIPIPTGKIRVDLIEENRLQWFAEALEHYRIEPKWWTFPASMAAAQDERQHVDPWEDLLRHMIANGREERAGFGGGTVREYWPDGWIASADIMQDWLRLDAKQAGAKCSTRLGQVMRRLGYTAKKMNGCRGWVAPADTIQPTEARVSGEVSA